MTAIDTLPILKKRMLEYLTALASKVTLEGAYGDNGESKGAEVVIRDLMNVLYGYDLKLEKKVNAAGFDLCDSSHHVMVQVSSNCTAEKVEECLRTTCERVVRESQLKDYTLYIVFLSVDNHCMETLRKNAANKLGSPELNDKRTLMPYPFQVTGIRFDPHRSIINLDTFLQTMRDSEDAAGRCLTSCQMRGLAEILDKFYSPIYLAEEICRQFPEKQPVYFSDGGQARGLCLQDIYNMLEDDSDAWVENIKARPEIPNVLFHTVFDPPQPFLPDPGRVFLEAILPTPAMKLIDQVATSNPEIYGQVMIGAHSDMLRRKLCWVFTDNTGRQFQNMANRCNSLQLELNSYLSRADLLIALLLWTPSRPRAVKDWYNKCQIGIDHCNGLAVLFLYALVGEKHFLSLRRDEIIQRIGG